MFWRILTAFSILCWIIICLFFVLDTNSHPSPLTLFLLNILILCMDIIVGLSLYHQN